MGKYTPEDMALVQEFLTIMPMLSSGAFFFSIASPFCGRAAV